MNSSNKDLKPKSTTEKEVDKAKKDKEKKLEYLLNKVSTEEERLEMILNGADFKAMQLLERGKTKLNFESITSLLRNAIKSLKPDPDIPVHDFMNQYVRIASAGGSSTKMRFDGPFTPWRTITEYFKNRKYQTICIVGSSRIGKTEITVVAGLAYCIYKGYKALLYHTDENKAKEFATNNLRPMLRHSPEVKARLEEGANKDPLSYNTKKGSFVLIRTPTVRALAGTTARYVFLTDYDRWPVNIGGEGNGYFLAKTRTTTFGVDGKTIIESSPGKPVVNFKSEEENNAHPHALPDANGIVEVYNQGTMFRYYLRCLSGCNQYFLPKWEYVTCDESLPDIKSIAESARLRCPHCGQEYDDVELKHLLTPQGKWVGAGQEIDNETGKISGDLPNTSIASFHLAAPLTCMKTLYSCKEDELIALQALASGKPELYQSFVNTVLGMPYMPVHLYKAVQNIEQKMEESQKNRARQVAPRDTCCVIACVDVQNGKKGSRFVVQIFAYTAERQLHVIDRFLIREYQGKKIDTSRHDYIEWRAIIDEVVNYEVEIDGTEFNMKPIATLVDSGGKDGSTRNAYNFYLEAINNGYYKRIFLVKGFGLQFRSKVKWELGKEGIARELGIELFKINSNQFKDDLFAYLNLPSDIPGAIVFNKDLPKYIYKELESEHKTSSGKYEVKYSHARNEAIDLFVYCLAYIEYNKLDQLAINQAWEPWFKPAEYGNLNAVIRETGEPIEYLYNQELEKEEEEDVTFISGQIVDSF